MQIFNQLPQVQQLCKYIDEGERIQSSLNQSINRCKKNQQSRSIQAVFQQNLLLLSEQIRKKIQLFAKIDNEASSQTIIPSRFNIHQLVTIQKDTLPVWFEYVLEKQLQKHIKGFNYLSKKIHLNKFSEQEKQDVKQLHSNFQTLLNRISSMQNKEKLSNNLLLDVNSIKNRIEHQENKYKQFLLGMCKRLIQFCEQNEQRARKYASQNQQHMKNIKTSDRVEPVIPQPTSFQVKYNNWSTKTESSTQNLRHQNMIPNERQYTLNPNSLENQRRSLLNNLQAKQYYPKQNDTYTTNFLKRGVSSTTKQSSISNAKNENIYTNIPKKLYEDFYY